MTDLVQKLLEQCINSEPGDIEIMFLHGGKKINWSEGFTEIHLPLHLRLWQWIARKRQRLAWRIVPGDDHG